MRFADHRFALAAPVHRAAVLDVDPRWADALDDAEIERCAPDAADLDLVVAAPSRIGDALGLDTRAVVVPGRARTSWPGWHGRRLLVRSSDIGPRVIAPLDDPIAMRIGLGTSVADSVPRRVARGLALGAARLGVAPPSATVTVVQQDAGLPFLVQAAERLGARSVRTWALQLGRGDALQRAVFHLVPEGATAPAWVLKFARVPGHHRPFDDDERALTTLRGRAPRAAERTPAFLGRDTIDDLHVSLETAAPGQPMNQVLSARGATPTNLDLVDDVARWAIALALESAQPPSALADEQRRLRDDVTTSRSHPGVDRALAVLDATADIPAVLQHNDLGSWNLMADGGAFTVLDWESFAPAGLPLWDLVYFLADALTAVDGPDTPEATVHRMVALFRGETTRSETLFGHVRDAVDRLGINPDAVGAIVTMCWVHHGRSYAIRRRALADTGGDSVPQPPLGRLADSWLDDPLLGPDWDRWRA